MPGKQPKIAVLLAAYNGAKWIEEQLSSILRQSAVDVTVFISIDASSDGTEALCAAFAARHACINVLPPAGTFGGASRNFFRLLRDIDLDEYDFAAFSDQDDVWHEDKLERAVDSIRLRDADGYSSNVTAFWSDGRTRLLDKAQPQVAWDFLFEAAGPGCTYVMSRKLLEPLKRSVLRNWEQLQGVSLHDWYCYAFARSHGFKWFIDPVASMQYRQHEQNQVGANDGLRSLLVRYKAILDGWWFSQIRLITYLVGKADDPFVQRWQQMRRWDLVRLSLSAMHCRRRSRDKVLFFIVCCVTAVLGNKCP
ncbi:glycosyltransferase [Pseudomonas frederiksbergensis]|uniref:glycosyltransferase n=1 Tax=Pseudomonas frederiksbergensis TaxID=104087 RepID=UPI002DBB4374|nr:glycosyltransferase [Pseudomonas frederiksbergensis]WRV66834.1 glycosyltransferase [Pseudomonas frederiksbergensis]